ncbi:MAG: sialate O-acetylesterase [Agathobacter sp.]|uniref:sialate O-acetylesterase n=1 Tax=Agathobacter sp. TaxID=2021311 RepID=UPI00258DD846|nr:sialate O-acetylesterase [Agathobacter sp.]MCR5677487.1 sialate O-acetylesterase [Agathobacter sp.]
MYNFSLAEIFGNGMVLQREKPIHIFGTAEPQTQVCVTLGEETCRAQADENGKWTAELSSRAAASDLKLEAKTDSGDTVTVAPVHIGDVWIAGGQSNMEFFNKYEKDWEHTRNLPMNPNIHFYNVPQRAFEGHETHNIGARGGYGKWLNDKEDGYENFSAIGYSFARFMQEDLSVPIGIIGCNWGGSTASTWLPCEALEEAPLNRYLEEYEAAVSEYAPEELRRVSLQEWEKLDEPESYRGFEPLLYGLSWEEQLECMKHGRGPIVPMGPYNENRPGGLYHTMLEPIAPYSLKGALWYQGESDCGDRAFMYDRLLTAMIREWRSLWQDELPFFVVQLAPFCKWLECTNDDYCTVRMQQQKVADTVPSVYLTSIMDLGSYYDIHPKEKYEIGRRLYLQAISHLYGKYEPGYGENPRIAEARRVGSHVICSFDFAKSLQDKGGKTDILMTDKEQIYAPLDVRLDEGKAEIDITIPEEAQDAQNLQIAMGWADYATIFICNEHQLPIAPFCVKVK